MKFIITISLALFIYNSSYSQYKIENLTQESLRLYFSLLSTVDSLDIKLESIAYCKTMFGGNVDFVPDSSIQIQSAFDSWIRFSPKFIIICLTGIHGLNPPFDKDVFYVYNIFEMDWEMLPGLIYKPDTHCESLLFCSKIYLEGIIENIR